MRLSYDISLVGQDITTQKGLTKIHQTQLGIECVFFFFRLFLVFFVCNAMYLLLHVRFGSLIKLSHDNNNFLFFTLFIKIIIITLKYRIVKFPTNTKYHSVLSHYIIIMNSISMI